MRLFIKNMACLSAMAAFSFVDCTNKTDAPQPTTGSLAGTLSPAGVGSVVVEASGGQIFTINANPATGYFGLKNLAPDDYRLTFTGNGLYFPPAARLVTVAAGQNLDLGTIAFRQALRGIPRGTITMRLDDTTYTATTVSGDVNVPGAFEVRAGFVHGNAREELLLNYLAPIRTGTFPMVTPVPAGSGASDGQLVRWRNNRMLGEFRVYFYSVPPSRLVITQCDTTARTIVGNADLQLYRFITGSTSGPAYPNTSCAFNLRF